MYLTLFKPTQQNFYSSLGHVIVAIEFISKFFFQFLDGFSAVLVKEVNERFEDVQMESGCDEFSVGPPFLAGRDEETISQPWFEESVFW